MKMNLPCPSVANFIAVYGIYYYGGSAGSCTYFTIGLL